MSEKENKGIKKFQEATVNHIIKSLNASGSKSRFLVADEVGLGKTIIARELIKRAQNSYKGSDKFKIKTKSNVLEVMYICSNQDIAKQNVDKLALFDEVSTQDKAPRSTLMMVKEPPTNNGLKLISITPKTSLELSNDTGTKEERFFIHALFSELNEEVYLKRESKNQSGWSTLTLKASQFFKERAKNTSAEEWANSTSCYYPQKIIELLNKKSVFKKLLLEEWSKPLQGISKFKENKYFNHINLKSSLFQNVNTFIALKKPRSNEDYEDFEFRQVQRHLIGQLREGLAVATLSGQKPDLIILDEFQNFSHILPDTSMEKSEERDQTARLAKLLFENNGDVKFIFLSATPFKFKMLEYGEASEGSYDSFWSIIQMLLQGDQETLANLKNGFNTYWDAIQDKKILSDSEIKSKALTAKKYIEEELKKIVVRTEKFSVAELRNPIEEELKKGPWSRRSEQDFEDGFLDKIRPIVNDIKYLQFIRKTAPEGSGWIAQELWQSIPFAYNLMGTDYQIFKKKFEGSAREYQDIRETVRKESKKGCSTRNWGEFSTLCKIDLAKESPNPKMRAFLSELDDENYGYFLWILPKSPYYQSKPYECRIKLPKKRLIFSHWQAVPQAVSILGSLHIEKKLTNFLTSNKDQISYDKQAHRFNIKLDYYNSKKGDADWGNFLLFFPFFRLAEINITNNNLGFETELQFLKRIGTKVKLAFPGNGKLTVDTNLKSLRPKCIFEFLLFLESKQHRQLLNENFSEIFKSSLENNRSSKEIRQFLSKNLNMNRNFNFSQEEWDYIIKIVVAGPGVALVRSLQTVDRMMMLPNLCADKNKKIFKSSYLNLHNLLHTQFRALFRSHHGSLVIAAFCKKYLNEKNIPTWNKIIDYNFQCQLQAMLDEWIYLLHVDLENQNDEKFLKTIFKIIGLPAGHPSIQRLPKGKEKAKDFVRRHIVQSFTDDKSQEKTRTASSEKPILRDQIRLSFNSPFWPFCLVTTSVGQEGLDFHRYCKDIIHWNLPRNPSNFEQREGRIRRYLGKSVRDAILEDPQFSWGNIAKEMKKYKPWHYLMEKVDNSIGKRSYGGLSPWWVYIPENGDCKDFISRWIYSHPFSKQAEEYSVLKESVLLYRLALGNPNPEDFLETLRRNLKSEMKEGENNDNKIKTLIGELTINLSPYFGNQGYE